jgi:hypothetical protein
MKTRNLGIFILLFAISSVMITCKKKETAASVTGADYAGTWTVSSNCGNYSMTVTASGDNVTLTNFHTGFTVTGTISGNSLTIPQQNRTSGSMGGPYTFQGTGTKNGNSLSITYTMKDTGSTLNCSANCTK